jgi:hypothetical protein
MTWALVENELQELTLLPNQRTNVHDLIGALRSIHPPAEVTTNGYDGGVSLHWEGYEIATYDDRYETYEFEDGRTDIKHWPRNTGEAVPLDLLADAKIFTAKRA